MAPEDTRLRKAVRLRVVDEARHSLEDAILAGKMRPGERLAETWLGEQLGVSRTTVREALLMLERQGLVVTIPRRGTFVARLSLQDALDISYSRALLEAFGVSIGYQRLDERAFDQLDGCIAEMAACALPADIPRLIQIDARFHSPLIACAGSPRLTELWASLNGSVGAMMLRSIEARGATIDYVISVHRALAAALRAGDRDAAGRDVMLHYISAVGLQDETGQQALAIANVTAGLYRENAEATQEGRATGARTTALPCRQARVNGSC